jgi:PadR family transcriptional regulator, regulatory protein PadR
MAPDCRNAHRRAQAQVNSERGNAATRLHRELPDLGKIRVVADLMRVTGPLLDVLEAFLDAFEQGQELHGWAIMRGTKRSGPTVYGVLERLEDQGWIVGSWEDQPADANTPRRRYYRLTPNGKAFAEQTIAQRRPEPYRRPRLQFDLVRGLLRAVLIGGAR